MLDATELARRIRDAMDKHKPEPITSSSVAKLCGVTPQAVYGWRKTGRVAKGQLLKLARITGKPSRYFLGEDEQQSVEAQAFKLADDWLSLTPTYRAMVRQQLDDALATLEKFPELREAQIASPPRREAVTETTDKR